MSNGPAVEDAFGGSPPPRRPGNRGDGEKFGAWIRRRGYPCTAVEVELEILRLVDDLEEMTDEFEGRARTAAQNESSHKSQWAQSFLTGDGTEGRRKALADVATDRLYEQRKIADGLKESAKERLLSLRAELDAMRSLSANIRAQT